MLAVKKLVKFAQSNFDNNARQFSYSTRGKKVKQIIFKAVQFCVRNEGGGEKCQKSYRAFLGPASTHQKVIVFSFKKVINRNTKTNSQN